MPEERRRAGMPGLTYPLGSAFRPVQHLPFPPNLDFCLTKPDKA